MTCTFLGIAGMDGRTERHESPPEFIKTQEYDSNNTLQTDMSVKIRMQSFGFNYTGISISL